MNCHYTSELIIKNWRHKTGKVCIYDFNSESFDFKPTDKVFSVLDLNSKEQDDFFQKQVEDGLGKIAARLKKGTFEKINSENEYNAVLKYFFNQVVRFGPLLDVAEHPLNQDSNFYDFLAQHEKTVYDTFIYNSPNYLFLNEAGFFHFPVIDLKCPSGYTLGKGFAITPEYAFLLFPKTYNPDEIVFSCNMIQHYSVGLDAKLTSHILIPEQIYLSFDRTELSDRIKQLRLDATKCVKAIIKMRELTTEMLEICGLSVKGKNDHSIAIEAK